MPVVDELTRASIYLDAAGDNYLEQVRSAGRMSKPKIDASRSAVVRLALERLAADLSADEVVAELRRRGTPNPNQPGRPRR